MLFSMLRSWRQHSRCWRWSIFRSAVRREGQQWLCARDGFTFLYWLVCYRTLAVRSAFGQTRVFSAQDRLGCAVYTVASHKATRTNKAPQRRQRHKKMAWRGGRCLAAIYLETAAGLRQRSVRKEEALAASAFEKLKSVGDTQHFDLGSRARQPRGLREDGRPTGRGACGRVADLARQAGLKRCRAPSSRSRCAGATACCGPTGRRSTRLHPAALVPAVSQNVSRHPGGLRAVAHGAMSSLRDGAARSLERKVASYKDGVLARIQRRADAVYAVIDGQRDRLVDAVDDLSPWRGKRCRRLPGASAAYNRNVAPELARLRSAPRTKPTVDVPRPHRRLGAGRACRPRFRGRVAPRGSRGVRGALAPSSSLDVRLRSGDRALAWMLLAATSSLPIYRSWHPSASHD